VGRQNRGHLEWTVVCTGVCAAGAYCSVCNLFDCQPVQCMQSGTALQEVALCWLGGNAIATGGTGVVRWGLCCSTTPVVCSSSR